MRKLSLLRAQTIGEYAIMVALVIAAVIAMQVYVQRTLQSRYRAGSRYLISQMRDVTGNPDLPSQYEPYYADSEFKVNLKSQQQTNFWSLGEMNRVVSEETNRTGNQVLLPGCAAGEAGCPGGP